MSQTIAQALLKIGAVGFKPDHPLTFKSGIKSPVYVDNRIFPSHPAEWRQVIRGFADIIKQKRLAFDVIAGIESAGIPHSAALGYELGIPSVFVRKAAKDHGTKKRVEGGDVSGRKVLLIEDHVTTSGSSLSGIEALRAEGATVTDCLAITSYGFTEAVTGFAQAGVTLHTLVSFEEILTIAFQQQLFTKTQQGMIEDWLQDPHRWATKHGF